MIRPKRRSQRRPSGLPELARDGAVALAFDARGISRRAGAPLLYAPVVVTNTEPPGEIWCAGEAEEYRNPNPERAIAIYRALAVSRDPRVRAGSLVRLARTLRKSNRADEALVVYEQIGALGTVQVADEAADLLARQERCALLNELHRLPELEREAAALSNALESGQWPLDRAGFFFQWEHAQRWLGSRGLEPVRESLTLAAAVEIGAGSSLPFVRIDADAFGHALSNLLDNAAKYAPDGAPIRVVVERKKSRIAVRVCDQGPGIPAKE